MGTPLIQQRRGKGSPTYIAPSHRYFGAISYAPIIGKAVRGEVIELVNSVGHSAPLMVIQYETGDYALLPATLGIKKGDIVWAGEGAEPKPGNILKLGEIPTGTFIYNIELRPFGGGELVRASGTAAQVVGKEDNKVIVKLPSRKTVALDPNCRATIGVIAGIGRKEKPFVKAGNKMKAMKAKGKIYPRVSGVAMNAKDHPFGGTHRRTKGRPTTTPYGAPPGRKVGLIAAKKTGRGK